MAREPPEALPKQMVSFRGTGTVYSSAPLCLTQTVSLKQDTVSPCLLFVCFLPVFICLSSELLDLLTSTYPNKEISLKRAHKKH